MSNVAEKNQPAKSKFEQMRAEQKKRLRAGIRESIAMSHGEWKSPFKPAKVS